MAVVKKTKPNRTNTGHKKAVRMTIVIFFGKHHVLRQLPPTMIEIHRTHARFYFLSVFFLHTRRHAFRVCLFRTRDGYSRFSNFVVHVAYIRISDHARNTAEWLNAVIVRRIRVERQQIYSDRRPTADTAAAAAVVARVQYCVLDLSTRFYRNHIERDYQRLS